MDLICAPFIGIKPKQLVRSANRIAYSKLDSTSVFLDHDNLKLIIKRMKKLLPPDLVSVPMGIISVLGDDDRELRQLHTDWLIQFFESRENTQLAIDQWHTYWDAKLELKRVNNKLQHPVAQGTVLERKPGVYMWPKPLIVQGAAKSNTALFWILYSIQPQGQQHGTTPLPLDIFTAGASSKIITFQDSQREMLLKCGERLTKEHFVSVSVADLSPPWATEVTTPAMESLFQKLGGTPMNIKQFEVDGEIKTATLGNMVDGLKSLVHRINNCTITDTAPPSPTTGFQRGGVEWIREEVSRRIEEWTRLEDVHQLLVPLDWVEREEICERIVEEVLLVQSWISALSTTFENIYDNYVCFHGDVDAGQMQRFMATYFKDCQLNWEKGGGGGGPLHLSFHLIEQAYRKLCVMYDQHNRDIIKEESELLKETSQRLAAKYHATIKSYIFDGDLGDASEFLRLNERVRTHFVALLARAFGYNGKLNNVAREYTQQLLSCLDEIWERLSEEYSLNRIQLENNVERGNNNGGVVVVVERVSANNGLENGERNMALYEKCESMERQIGRGQVQLGTLTKKIILEAIRRGKAAARENMVRKEADEIDDIFTAHNFQSSF